MLFNENSGQIIGNWLKITVCVKSTKILCDIHVGRGRVENLLHYKDEVNDTTRRRK